MVPLHLRLYNFLSYQGETDFDLRGIHVGCLSGDNGNGKSALLDAVTWALWGWARGRKYGTGGASPDELVYQGQTDMEVALTFAAGEATYRMVRKHSKGGGRRGAARMVDLQAATGDGFRSLTEGSVADTEKKVVDLLRMSYETFVNSAFLLQGEADRFTTSKPAQRKETLAEILGLSFYERLQERARERVREHDGFLLRNQLDREGVERELAARPTVEAALDEARRVLEGHAPLLATARADEAALDARVTALARVQEEADRLWDVAAQRLDEAERLGSQAGQARARVEQLEAVLSRRDEIYHGASTLTDAREQLQELDAEQQRDASLERQAMELEHAIVQAADRLSAEADRLSDRSERELRPRAERGQSAEAELAEVSSDEALVDGQREAVQSLRAEIEDTARAIAQAEADNQRLDAELAELRNSYRMLREGETDCPLCGARLGADGLEHLRQEMEQRGRERRSQFDHNGERLALMAPQRKSLETELAQAETGLEEAQRRHAARLAELQREVAEGETAEVELVSVTQDLDALTRRIDSASFAQEERRELAAVLARRTAVAYDADYHAEVRQTVRDYERFADLARDLRNADERLPQERESLAEFTSLAGDAA